MVRRQAWQQSEPFWSPPTRRVAQAVMPALTAGFLLGVMAVAATKGTFMAASTGGSRFIVLALPLAWIVLYGCALHASGFFMTRGMSPNRTGLSDRRFHIHVSDYSSAFALRSFLTDCKTEYLCLLDLVTTEGTSYIFHA